MATDVEILARLITNQVLTIDAGAGRNIGDLTNNDASGSIYTSWLKICEPLVPWINTHGSGSSGSGSIWGLITGNIEDQTDLYNELTTLSGSIVNRELLINKSSDINLGTSNTLYPTQNAVKTYVDNNISASSSVTTASNVGVGEGEVYKEKVGNDLRFKTIKAGSNIILTNNSDEVLITAVSGGVMPSGSSIWGQIIGTLSNQTDLYNELTTLSGSIVNRELLTNKSTDINLGVSDVLYPTQNAVKTYVDNQIVSSSSITNVQNIGDGEGNIFSEISGSIINLKTLKAGDDIGVVNTANTVEIHKIKEDITNRVITFSSSSLFKESQIYYPSVISLSDNSFAVAYVSGSLPNVGKLKIGYIEGSSVTFGDEYIFETGSVYIISSICNVAEDKFAIVYNTGALYNGGIKIITFSGSIVQDVGDSYYFGEFSSGYPLLKKIEDNKLLLTHGGVNSSPPYQSAARVVNVSGSIITYGSASVFDNTGTPYFSTEVLSLTKFILCYTNVDDPPTYSGYCRVGTMEGNNISFSSPQIYENPFTGILSTAKLNSSEIVIIYMDTSEQAIKSRILKKNNNDDVILIGEAKEIESTVGHSYTPSFLNTKSLSTNVFAFIYTTHPDGVTNYSKFILGTITESIPSFSDYYTFLSMSEVFGSVGKDLAVFTNDVAIVVYHDNSDGGKGKYFLCNFEIPNIDSIQNIGTGEGEIYKETINNIASLKTIKAGNNITIINNVNDITINCLTGLQVFSNNASAVSGGLSSGSIYRTGADPDLICIVH
ncbi:MAG: hypothetical protein WC346_21785 [Methanogenium sp.]|jgi:hypothetical protein